MTTVGQPSTCTFGGGDCNDDPVGGGSIYPGRADICDGIDNDCNSNTPDGKDETWYGQACDDDIYNSFNN